MFSPSPFLRTVLVSANSASSSFISFIFLLYTCFLFSVEVNLSSAAISSIVLSRTLFDVLPGVADKIFSASLRRPRFNCIRWFCSELIWPNFSILVDHADTLEGVEPKKPLNSLFKPSIVVSSFAICVLELFIASWATFTAPDAEFIPTDPKISAKVSFPSSSPSATNWAKASPAPSPRGSIIKRSARNAAAFLPFDAVRAPVNIRPAPFAITISVAIIGRPLLNPLLLPSFQTSGSDIIFANFFGSVMSPRSLAASNTSLVYSIANPTAAVEAFTP